MNILFRKANIEDTDQLRQLFRETVMSTSKKDYRPEQLEVWASSSENNELWKNKLSAQYFIVAEFNSLIIGFGSLEEDYLDFLYVHKNYIRKGVATRIFMELEKEFLRNKFLTLHVDASRTAKPFFEKNGFCLVKENHKMVKGIEIINFHMIKTFF